MLDFFGVGAGPQNLGSPGSAGLVAYASEIYQTGLLDLTVPTLGIELIPGRAGFIPWRISNGIIIEQASGTQTTPPVIQIGTDPTHTNMATPTSTPANTDANGAVGNTPCQSSTGVGNANAAQNTQKFPGQPAILDVTSGGLGTGGYTLKARIWCQVIWMSVG